MASNASTSKPGGFFELSAAVTTGGLGATLVTAIAGGLYAGMALGTAASLGTAETMAATDASATTAASMGTIAVTARAASIGGVARGASSTMAVAVGGARYGCDHCEGVTAAFVGVALNADSAWR